MKETLEDGRVRVGYSFSLPLDTEETEVVEASRVQPMVYLAGGLSTHDRVVVKIPGGPNAPATVLAFFPDTRALVAFSPWGCWDGADGKAPADMVLPFASLTPQHSIPPAPWVAAAEEGHPGPRTNQPDLTTPSDGEPLWVWHRGAYLLAVREFFDSAGLAIEFPNGAVSDVSLLSVIQVPPMRRRGAPYAADEPVYVEWNHMYFDGTVRGPGSSPDHYRVHYAGTDAKAEPTVPVERLRPRTPL